MIDRRRFIQTAAATATAATLPLGAGNLLAGHHAKKRFELALSQYSLRALLKDGSLDALDFPKFTVDQFGIKAIDLWEGGLPKDKLDDAGYMDKMKAAADKAGTDLFLFMAPPLMCDKKKYKMSSARILASLKRAEMLDCDLLRVFLKVSGTDVAAGVDACVEGLKPIADKAGKAGVTIAIEPGSSKLAEKGSFHVKVMEKLKHEHVKLMPDFGKQKGNVYEGTEVMLPHSISVSCKMHSFDEKGNQPDFDYPRLMKMIVASKYKGYLAIEWEGKKLKPVEGVKASKKLIESSLKAAGVTI